MNGTTDDDILIGDDLANVINGLAGDDLLSGFGGDDTLSGGDGNDTLSGGPGDDTLNGDQGMDNLVGGIGNDILNGGDGDDILAGGTGMDVIDGGAGNDTNSFQIIATDVNVTLNADGSGTAAYGSVVESFTGIENVVGSSNDDTLIATGAASNEITGGAGDDFIAGGGGVDILDGGDGIDTNSFQGIGFDVVANLGNGTASYQTPGGTVFEGFSNFENLDGSANNDILSGNGDDNVLSGNDGNDELSGGGGSDTLEGGRGDDTLIGGLGNDILNGGEGFDTADFSDLDVPVVIDLDANGNGTATRETGFSISSTGQPLASLTTGQTPEELVEEAINNRLYYNIHTTDFPGGEIRGQLLLQSDITDPSTGVRTITLAAALDASQEPGPTSDSLATGEGTVVITVDGNTITYSNDLTVSGIATSDLLPVAGVSSIHLHNAEAGANGPVITDLIQDAGGDVDGNTTDPDFDTGDGDVFVEATETDQLISIENVILSSDPQVVEGSVPGLPDSFDGQSFTDLDDGDQFVFNGASPFSTAAIAVSGQDITVPGATFMVDGNLDEGNFLAATNNGSSTTVAFVDELLGDGLDLIEGQAVNAADIDGISFAEFVGGNGSDTDGTDFTVTLDNSTSGFENSFGVFVFDTASGQVSDAQIVADNAQNGGSITVDNVTAGEQLGFFIIQDGAGDSFNFTSGTLADLSAASGSEIFQSIDASANSDGSEHFLSGSVDGGGALRVGVEDLTGLGDSDFQDVVFTVERTENFDDPLAVI